MTKEKKVIINLVGLDGNAFSFLGEFQKAAEKQGFNKQFITKVREEAMTGDYNHLLNTLLKYSTSEEDEENYELDDDREEDEFEEENEWDDDEED